MKLQIICPISINMRKLTTSLSHLNGTKATNQCPRCFHARMLVGSQLYFAFVNYMSCNCFKTFLRLTFAMLACGMGKIKTTKLAI